MAAPAVDDDAVIKERLLTRTAIIGRPSPLRVLTAKFHAFLDALDNGKATDSSEAEVLYEQLLKELTTFEFMNSKYHTMRSASARERRHYSEQQLALQEEISSTQVEIEQLKEALESERLIRRNNEEYEALRKLISALPPRKVTQAQIDSVDKEVAKLEAEDVDTEREQDVRRKQFALLLHAVDDLQRALVDEPLETPAAAADPNTNATPMSIG
mmetsp:Transcript_8372/g.30894  ORF Transcript_8372/g.30894 Transcript_8372/m.30894 type:complete len:214 (+) Transcript_8372:110-751(+)